MGYTAGTGNDLQRIERAEEAIRLTRMLQHLTPADGVTSGLLALTLLAHARRGRGRSCQRAYAAMPG